MALALHSPSLYPMDQRVMARRYAPLGKTNEERKFRKTREGVLTSLKEIGHTVRQSPRSLQSLCIETLHAEKLIPETDMCADLQDALHETLHLQHAVMLYKNFRETCCTVRSLPCMPQLITDPRGNYILAKSETEFYLYLLNSAGIQLVLHGVGPTTLTSDFSYLIFTLDDDIMMYDLAASKASSTGISRSDFERRTEQHPFDMFCIIYDGKVLRVSRKDDPELEKVHRENPDKDLFWIFPDWAIQEIPVPNGANLRDTCIFEIFSGESLARAQGVLSPFGRHYTDLLQYITSGFLSKTYEGQYVNTCWTLTPDGRFLACYGNNLLKRIDLAKLGSFPEDALTAVTIEGKRAEKVALSHDGTYCLIIVESSKKCQEWAALPQPTMVNEADFQLRNLLLVNMETQESVVILKSVNLMHCGFLRPGSCFYAWDANDHFYIYDLNALSRQFSYEHLSHLIASGTPETQKSPSEQSQGNTPTKRTEPFEDIWTFVDGKKVKLLSAHDILVIPADASRELIEEAFRARNKYYGELIQCWSQTKDTFERTQLAKRVERFRPRNEAEEARCYQETKSMCYAHAKFFSKTVHKVLAIIESAYKTMIKNLKPTLC